MTIPQKLFSVKAVLLLLAFSSCDDEDKVSQVSRDDAKTKISQFNSTAISDLQNFSDADGLQAVGDFFDLTSTDDPFGRVVTEKKKLKAYLRNKGQGFRNLFALNKNAKTRTAEDAFDFNAHKGIYTWNPNLEEFEKTGNSNIIKIQFPTEGSITNNAELQLIALIEVEVYDEEDDAYYFQPEVLKADLLVNNVKKAALDLNIVWDDAGFPLTGEVTALATPYQATISVDASGSTSSTVLVSFMEGQKTIISTRITATYKDSSKSEESLKLVSGYLVLNELKLEGTVNVEAANKTEVDWNEILQLAVYSGNDKLGDIIYVEENNEPVAYIKYQDGTKEKIEVAFKPVLDEMDDLTEDLDTNG